MSSVDDGLFITSMLLCMALGSYYKKIEDVTVKRNYGAGLGILVACILCGDQFLHSAFIVWGNIIIIKCCDKSYLHQMSLAYTWTYLTYIHYNLQLSIYSIWIHQTIALRLVGLAFETYMAEKLQHSASTDASVNGVKDEPYTEPTAVDIIVYSYFFVGLHKGPYYRWKIFNDHFKAPFGILGDCRIITEHKLKKALICSVVYLILRQAYSPDAYYYDEFYLVVGNESRYLYSIPQLIIYFLKTQVVMMLCTGVCTETGFGVYPAKCSPLPGHGPTAGASLLKLASTTANVALQQEYNFAMLKCFDNKKLIFGPKMRDTLKGWDMSTRYWFRMYIYKQLKANREIRSACTFAAWWIWSGPTPQLMLMSATLWVYVLLEDEYSELFPEGHGGSQFPWNVGFSLMRLFCLLYLTPCIVLRDTIVVLRYYNSIHWIYHIIMFLFLFVVVIINYFKRNR